jgi:glycerol-3-phosphate dehydrogenase
LAKKTYSRRCIICFAGLRPLAAPEKKEKTKEVSRSQQIIVSETGLITITGGGQLTEKLPKTLLTKQSQFVIYLKECKTEHIPIHGNIITTTLDQKTIYTFTELIFLKIELQTKNQN